MYIARKSQVVLTIKDLQAIRATMLILDEVLDEDDDFALDIDTSSVARANEALCDFVNNCEVDTEEK